MHWQLRCRSRQSVSEKTIATTAIGLVVNGGRGVGAGVIVMVVDSLYKVTQPVTTLIPARRQPLSTMLTTLLALSLLIRLLLAWMWWLRGLRLGVLLLSQLGQLLVQPLSLRWLLMPRSHIRIVTEVVTTVAPLEAPTAATVVSLCDTLAVLTPTQCRRRWALAAVAPLRVPSRSRSRCGRSLVRRRRRVARVGRVTRAVAVGGYGVTDSDTLIVKVVVMEGGREVVVVKASQAQTTLLTCDRRRRRHDATLSPHRRVEL